MYFLNLHVNQRPVDFCALYTSDLVLYKRNFTQHGSKLKIPGQLLRLQQNVILYFAQITIKFNR